MDSEIINLEDTATIDIRKRHVCWTCVNLRYFVMVEATNPKNNDSNEIIARRLRMLTKAFSCPVRKFGCHRKGYLFVGYRTCSRYEPSSKEIDLEHPEIEWLGCWKKATSNTPPESQNSGCFTGKH